jgi:hypothetical protein
MVAHFPHADSDNAEFVWLSVGTGPVPCTLWTVVHLQFFHTVACQPEFVTFIVQYCRSNSFSRKRCLLILGNAKNEFFNYI